MRRVPLLLGGAVLLIGCSRIVVLNDPLSAAEHHDLGLAYESRGELDLAARQYRKALRKNPHLAIARVNLGNVAAARERWREAERCYRAALADRPDDPDALNNLAVALVRQGRRLEEAEALATRALARAASDSVVRATLEEVRAARKAPRAGAAGGRKVR